MKKGNTTKDAKKKVSLSVKTSLSKTMKKKAKTVAGLKDNHSRRKLSVPPLNKEDAARYLNLIENIDDGYFEVDLAGNFTFFNNAVCRILGYSRKELMGKNNRFYCDQEEAKKIFNTFGKIYKTGKPLKEFGCYITRKDGTKRFIEGSVYLRKNSSGKPIGFLGIAHDVTERKQAETSLRRSEDDFRSLFEQSIDGIIIFDASRIVMANRAFLAMSGHPLKKLMDINPLDFLHPDDRETARQRLKKLLSGQRIPEDNIYRAFRADGSPSWVELRTTLIEWKAKPAFQTIVRDITERKKAEEALQKSERYFKEITENSSDILIITDQEGIIKYCSRSVERFLGYKPEELIGRSGFPLIHPDDLPRAAADYTSAILEEDGRLIPNTFRVMHKDGSEVYLDGLGKNLLGNPDVAGFVMNVRDITERRLAEEKLRREEERFQALAKQSQDIIIFVNREGIITYANPAMERILRFKPEQQLGTAVFDLIHPDDLYHAINASNLLFNDRNASIQKIEMRLRHKDGGCRIFDSMISSLKNGNVIDFVMMIFHDITERKKAEHALMESEQRYRELSIIDDLTQLYNSRHFHARLKQEIERSNRYGHPLTLLLMDIDKFKNFNDTYGHVEGDFVLSRLGHLIKRCLRETDSAYRYGGEEFTVILPMTRCEEGIVIAKRILSEFWEEAFSPATGPKVHMTASIGISQYKPCEDIKVFVQRVDQLMYKVKQTERGRICSENGMLH